MAEFFRKLFGGNEKTEKARAEMATTAPLSDQQIQSIVHSQSVQYEMQQLVAAAGQSVGKQREHNEDSLLAITTTLAGKTSNVPFGLYIVADGMGGHQFGEVASNETIRVVAGSIMRKFHSYLFNIPSQQPEESLQEIMESAIKEAHRVVQKDAPGSGTTITAALVIGQQVTMGHVGDSRAYIVFPAGRVEQVTRDHSLVKRLEELGHLNQEEAAAFPHRNVLIRAVGQGDALEVDVFTITFPSNGTLMLCSDGLWGVVAEQDLFRSLSEAPNLQRACQNMVTAANTAGGPDNISVILVQMIG
ncbi:MAG TPA: protein phosphatase 2C domain-containing protein [Anaerolineales bacterium]|jgi:serine/threonine protein phosphatase PrpC|nr:protein phosphatase 2C domain-containing protein [Anaerolineales bacterium]